MIIRALHAAWAVAGVAVLLPAVALGEPAHTAVAALPDDTGDDAAVAALPDDAGDEGDLGDAPGLEPLRLPFVVVPIARNAGVGGEVAYAQRGVIEIGGSAVLSGAANFTRIGLNPRVGWFFQDNLALSAILGINHISSPDADATFLSLLAEPSAHVEMDDGIFGFLAVGAGVSYARGAGFGLAVAPRLGLRFLVGRSGIVTPALHVQYNTQAGITTPHGSLLRVRTGYGLGVDFSIMY
jgi:hypothetical protein